MAFLKLNCLPFFFHFFFFSMAFFCNFARVFFAKLREFFAQNSENLAIFRRKTSACAQVIFFIAEFLFGASGIFSPDSGLGVVIFFIG